MPEWPKMVIFLPKGTPKNDPAFGWHKTLSKARAYPIPPGACHTSSDKVWPRRQEFGQRLMVLAVVNDTQSETAIMNIFKLTKEEELPAIKVIKAGSVDLKKGNMEVYQAKVQPWEWTLGKARELAAHAALKPLQKQAGFPLNSNLQITSQRQFYDRCITKTGRCAVYFVNIDKYKEQLKVMKEAMEGMETYFYHFHPMWADVSIARSVFNFKQVDTSKSPQLVILDAKEKVFAPMSVEEGAEKIRNIFRMFDQPKAMKRIKDGMKKGKSALATEQTPTTFGTHTEL